MQNIPEATFARLLKSAAKSICPPFLRKKLRKLIGRPRGRLVRTLEEIDRAIARADAAGGISDEAFRAAFNFTFDPGKLRLPSDPDSDEYREAQMELYRRISGRPSYDPLVDEQTPITPEQIAHPFPYLTKSYCTVGEQLMSVGFLIRAMALPAGSSILEFGPGWGLTTLELIQMGYDVTAVDVNPSFLEIIGERARRLDQKVELDCADMQQYRPARRYDRVLFYECFHHALDHRRFIERMHTLVKPGGAVVFAGEPVEEEFYCPWGVRMDGQSVWSIRKFGWMELGFRMDYFEQLLKRNGWKMERQQCVEVPRMSVIVARRT